jgi:anaerobic magnesium-protoporphyrin IX monomethyl ester cyclase|tara:strand:+ start:1062 stop:2594 length:1533 start_codon:yes stop_codon:yes gene_type:complete
MDVLFINPGSSKDVYQGLSTDYAGIGTPYWLLLLSQSCRSQGYNVGVLDILAEKLLLDDAITKIKELNPRLITFCVYGENVNSGTTQMSGAVRLANLLKECGVEIPISFVGSHVQALPYKVLDEEPNIDIIFTNEGVYSLWNILKLDDLTNLNQLQTINGIGFIKDDKPFLTKPERIVPQKRMDLDLPGYAWDLLPYDKKPFDLYRSPMWHGEYDHDKRTPYAALYTSLGCVFQCEFCMINILNRDDLDEVGVAGNYNKMRFWSPEFIIKEFDKLVEMGVETIRIADEMFLLNPKYYVPLTEMLSKRPYADRLRMWAYSRVDTIRRPGVLKLLRKAGIKWLCLGIESADKNVRLEVSKGKFEDVNIEEVVNQIHGADIGIIANYMFGLPGDTFETMQKTLDLSLELNTIAWNAYAAMPLPGSQLYKNAVESGFDLPEDYAGYSFHAYTTKPLPTDSLTPEEILKFRDDAYLAYHTDAKFLNKVQDAYGSVAVKNIIENTKVKLKRKILGD